MADPALRLNLNRLRTFEAIARLKSFTGAARELGVSQPAVTMQVRELEAYFGLRLVDRSKRRRVELTRDGDVLSGYATQILATALEAEQAIGGARELQSGRLPLVASATAASYLLPPVLGAFRARYPGIQVQLLSVNSRDALAQLLAFQADLGVLTGPVRDAQLVTVPFVEDRLVLAVSPRHRLAHRRQVDVRDLAGERMIIREKGSATRALVESELRRAGVRIDVTMELQSNEATVQAVAAGHGAAILSAAVARREVESARLVALSVRGVTLRRAFWFVYHRERGHYPTVRQFVETGTELVRRRRDPVTR